MGQLRTVSKEEAHALIDAQPGNEVVILTFDKNVGLTSNLKSIKKNKGKSYVNKADVIVLSSTDPITTLDLQNCVSDIFGNTKRNISKTILLDRYSPGKITKQKNRTCVRKIIDIDI